MPQPVLFPACIMEVVGFEITLKEGCIGFLTVYFGDSFLEVSLKDMYERTSERKTYLGNRKWHHQLGTKNGAVKYKIRL